MIEENKIEENPSSSPEVKNSKYKSMFLNSKSTKELKDLSNLDKFLEDEKNNNKSEPWSKLDKTNKIKKLQDFVLKYSGENELNEEETKTLMTFFKDCLDKKKLARVKDVIYDKETGSIKEIPGLFFNKQSKNFTLKNIDNKTGTGTQKATVPIKKVHTAKNKNNINSNKSSECDSDCDDN
jgi:hypothetical protein